MDIKLQKKKKNANWLVNIYDYEQWWMKVIYLALTSFDLCTYKGDFWSMAWVLYAEKHHLLTLPRSKTILFSISWTKVKFDGTILTWIDEWMKCFKSFVFRKCMIFKQFIFKHWQCMIKA